MDIKVYTKHDCDKGLFPLPLRCLLVGSSGCGKTNLLLNFIYDSKCGLPYQYLYVFSRSIEQPAYAQLRQIYDGLEVKYRKNIAHFFSSCEELVSLNDCKPNSLVVFDDCVLDSQEKIKEYFVRGRHNNISCIYLSQSYGKVDMQVIRNNVNFICVFKQNKHYTKRIYEDFVGSDMSLAQFENLCKTCWGDPHGFIAINVNRKVNDGKYRCNLNKTLKVK